jgi:hypothetical protein
MGAAIEAVTRWAVELVERRAQRLRGARGRQACAERARVAAHRAADAAICRRTADPTWWTKVSPEQVGRAWRVVSTWHEVDAGAAGVRRAMDERLQTQGVDLDTRLASNPGDVAWLRGGLHLADVERAERLAASGRLVRRFDFARRTWRRPATPLGNSALAPRLARSRRLHAIGRFTSTTKSYGAQR